ncbi:DUF86 domain-containing protein [Roseomonas genomospecies 6]|uniref:DUF86 domain-containing protein n=1 Tax=Roseomonas genomospecies 6 TaxID=214106 RepID=A0A9W7NG28_9PROT|nr:DUF86 domain-containing protein [Roseomonas genomospecies 6]KAA0676376.1 DUF86 domain-containing protein [Roseomonas genomospecies 6]
MNGDRAYLEHIRESIRRVMEYTATGRDDFFARTLLQDGVIRNLEIIGEATKKLSPELRSRYPDLPWKNMAALRDVLIHNYLGVDLSIVWDVVVHRLPGVDRRIADILGDFEEDPTAAP